MRISDWSSDVCSSDLTPGTCRTSTTPRCSTPAPAWTATAPSPPAAAYCACARWATASPTRSNALTPKWPAFPGRASSTATTSAGARSSASAAACRSGFSRALLPLLPPCEAAPAKACGFESPAAVPPEGKNALRARLALEHRHPLTRHPQARLVHHAQARQVERVGGGDDRCNRRVAQQQRHQRLHGFRPQPPSLTPGIDRKPADSDAQVGGQGDGNNTETDHHKTSSTG